VVPGEDDVVAVLDGDEFGVACLLDGGDDRRRHVGEPGDGLVLEADASGGVADLDGSLNGDARAVAHQAASAVE
jgi:hypothetical protein